MDLVCGENYDNTNFSPKKCTTIHDPVIHDDERVLHNLLVTQDRYVIKTSYFKCLQTDLDVQMREQVANWMLEVCEEERCEKDVFPLAMNIMDRFLSQVRIRKSQLQLLGAVSLFISSKVKQLKPLHAHHLILYSDYSITRDQLSNWELLVLSHLKWDTSAVTPNDFLNLILHRLPARTKRKDKLMTIQKHAEIFIALCSTDFRFSMLPPSSIAASCIATAILGLTRNNSQITKDLIAQLCKLTNITNTDLLEIRRTIEEVLEAQSNHNAFNS